MTEADNLVELELMLNRFNRLMGELMRGAIARNVFQPWEIDLLLDFESCPLDRRRRREILRQYQKAVERQLEIGPGPPMKLSEFLAMRAAAKEHRLNG
jgi:ABC-type molybdate transport system ATPase subunit